jgi:hypothetical protein
MVFSWASPGKLSSIDMATVTDSFTFSDWLFLYYIGVNMDPYLFRELLTSLTKEKLGISRTFSENYDSDSDIISEKMAEEKKGYVPIDTVDGIHQKHM